MNSFSLNEFEKSKNNTRKLSDEFSINMFTGNLINNKTGHIHISPFSGNQLMLLQILLDNSSEGVPAEYIGIKIWGDEDSDEKVSNLITSTRKRMNEIMNIDDAHWYDMIPKGTRNIYNVIYKINVPDDADKFVTEIKKIPDNKRSIIIQYDEIENDVQRFRVSLGDYYQPDICLSLSPGASIIAQQFMTEFGDKRIFPFVCCMNSLKIHSTAFDEDYMLCTDGKWIAYVPRLNKYFDEKTAKILVVDEFYDTGKIMSSAYDALIKQGFEPQNILMYSYIVTERGEKTEFYKNRNISASLTIDATEKEIYMPWGRMDS